MATRTSPGLRRLDERVACPVQRLFRHGAAGRIKTSPPMPLPQNRTLSPAGLRLHDPPDNIDHPLLALELLDGPLLGSSQRRSVLHLHTSIIVFKDADELQVEHLKVSFLVVPGDDTMLWQHLAGNLNMPSTRSALYASRFDPLGVQKISLRHS